MARNEYIAGILDAHGIVTKTENGRLYAYEVGTINGELHIDLVDVTDFTTAELYTWLGY